MTRQTVMDTKLHFFLHVICIHVCVCLCLKCMYIKLNTVNAWSVDYSHLSLFLLLIFFVFPSPPPPPSPLSPPPPLPSSYYFFRVSLAPPLPPLPPPPLPPVPPLPSPPLSVNIYTEKGAGRGKHENINYKQWQVTAFSVIRATSAFSWLKLIKL